MVFNGVLIHPGISSNSEKRLIVLEEGSRDYLGGRSMVIITVRRLPCAFRYHWVTRYPSLQYHIHAEPFQGSKGGSSTAFALPSAPHEKRNNLLLVMTSIVLIGYHRWNGQILAACSLLWPSHDDQTDSYPILVTSGLDKTLS